MSWAKTAHRLTDLPARAAWRDILLAKCTQVQYRKMQCNGHDKWGMVLAAGSESMVLLLSVQDWLAKGCTPSSRPHLPCSSRLSHSSTP